MKKFFLAITLLIFLTVFISAQGLNFYGDMVTGFVFIAPGPENEARPGEKEKTDIRMKGESVDAPTNRLRLNGELDGGNYGVKFRLSYDFEAMFNKLGYKDGIKSSEMENMDNRFTYNWGFDPADQCAWVWGDFFYNALRLSAGKIGDNVWNTTLIEKWGLEEYKTGVRVEINAHPNIRGGILFKIPPQYVRPEEQYTFQRLLNEMIIGFRYDNSVLSAALALELDGMDNRRSDEQELAAGFMYRGKPGLQTGFEAKMQNLGWSKNYPFDYTNFSFNIMQMAGYDFSSQIYGRLKIYEEKKAGEDTWSLNAYPFMIYKFSRWLEAGGELGFGADMNKFSDTWYFAVKPVMYYHLGAFATLGAYWYSKFVHCYNYVFSSEKYDPFYTEIGLVFYWSF